MRNVIVLRLRLLAFIALLLPAGSPGAQGASKWTPEETMKVRPVGGARPSPDGRWVAFTVNQAVMTDDKSEYLTQIWVAAADGSGARQFTFGDKSSQNPQWSPDGQWILYGSARAGKPDVWRIAVGGGEPEQLTEVATDAGAFALSPDGKWLAYTMTDPLTAAGEKARKARDDAQLVDANIQFARLYVAPVDKDAQGKRTPRLLTRDNFHVGGGLGGGGALDWSPDSRSVVFAHFPSPSQNDWTEADLSVVDVATAERRPLATTRAAENDAHYSPDGRWIAFTASDNPPTWAFTRHVYVVAATGGQPRRLAVTFDEQPNILGWAADGRSLYYSESQGTLTRVSQLPVDGTPPRLVDAGERGIGGATLNATATMLAFTGDKSDAPPEAFVTPLSRWSPVQVSRVNAGAPNHPLGVTEVLRWKSKDGKEVEGLLTYPVGYQRGQRVPMVVVVHGGPTGVFNQGFIGARGTYPIAAFAAEGYAVLRCNVRGSSGYGRAFRYANYNDWGGGDLQDILSGVEHTVSLGVADTDRVGIMGWSYGGYMTAWTITQTNRFKAASVGAGLTNLMSFTGTADVPGFLPDYLNGEPWENLDAYRAHSAMFSVKNVTTPTLIQHGERDVRVPATQGYELYNALKRQNKTVRMVVYPRQGHGLAEPRLVLDAGRRNIEWFAKYLLGRGADWVP